MPTTRRKLTRTTCQPVPEWWLHFLKTGEQPPEDHPDREQFDNAWLLAGWAEQRGWPPPHWDRHPARGEW